VKKLLVYRGNLTAATYSGGKVSTAVTPQRSDDILTGWEKINANFEELRGLVGQVGQGNQGPQGPPGPPGTFVGNIDGGHPDTIFVGLADGGNP
jgi:hypothetical protein